MSTRSIRKTPRGPEAGIVDPQVAKAHATAAASRAMRSSERSSAESRSSYDRLGGPKQVAVPRRRPESSLQETDDGLSVYSVPAVPPVTPRQSMATGAAQPCVGQVVPPPPITDLQGLDGQDSSAPSSYRRLRKAKSMFSTKQRSSHIAYTASPKSPRNALDLDRSPGFELPRTLRPSISFIGGGNRQGSRAIRHAKSHDAAIQLARSQFLEESEGAGQTRLSSFFMSRHRREPKPFRKTFRVTSDTGIGGVSPEQASFKRARRRSRTFSASIKKGLKRVFGLSKPVEQTFQLHDELPSVVVGKPTVEARPVGTSIAPDESISVKHWKGANQLQPTQISPGRDSICTSSSRVTSWADSTAANTITTRKTGHRQSLSLIEEHGDLNLSLPQMPVRTGAENCSPRSNARRFDGWVNSQDLYTALMQQIGQNAVHNPEEEVTFGTVPEHRVIPERTSSVYSYRSRRSIRRIPSGDSSPVSFATAHRGDSQSPRRRSQPSRYVQQSRVSPYSPGQENCRPLSTLSVDNNSQQKFPVGEQSDESTGSVVVAHFGDLNQLSASSSVYSRSAGGTPTKDTEARDGEVLGSYGEPGTVTIFPSERHSSPAWKARSNPPKARVQPSADWQQWMSAQVERIESTNPAREHVRETAQYQEDEDDYLMGMVRRAPGPGSESTVRPYVEGSDEQVCDEIQAPTERNFSRPFSRSSSLRTIVSPQKIEPSFAAVESIHNPPDVNVNANHAENALPILGELSNENSASPMRVRSTNLRKAADSPTPQRSDAGSQKRTWTQDQYRRYSVRRPLANGKPNSFRSMRTYRDYGGLNNENTRQQEQHDQMMGEYHKLQDIHSTVSSKHMVEMFLNSRRRPVEMERSTDKADVFL
ncbi:hypothetical protein PENDEC_c011G06795 [Penicillium decumbens]|uniref:Uncharacterized protein n=1 Tax=Penicillium decumbens TaxID=69771 RepID=A0A1V6PBB2_PENDC|nr:hypothetical protein PENDEC_c011G06795 [Penicillium decumbens]